MPNSVDRLSAGCRSLPARIAACALLAGVSACSPRPNKPEATAPVPRVPAKDPIPERLGSLRITQERGSPGQYRVTTGNGTTNFLADGNFLLSVFSESRMPEDTKERAILAYPKMLQGMEDRMRRMDAEAKPVEHAPVTLKSTSGGNVLVEVDKSDPRFATFEVAGVRYTLNAAMAFRVIDSARLTDDKKLDALLKYPMLRKSPAAAHASPN